MKNSLGQIGLGLRERIHTESHYIPRRTFEKIRWQKRMCRYHVEEGLLSEVGYT